MRHIGVIFAAIFLAISATASAATFQVTDSRLVISDVISPGDEAEMKLILEAHPNIREVVLESNGGDVVTGLAMGRLIRRSGLITKAGDTCHSACGYLLMGGVQREGLRHGVHRFSMKDGSVEAAQELTGHILRFLREMDIDLRYFEITSEVPADGMRWLTGDELRSLNIITGEAQEVSATVSSVPATGSLMPATAMNIAEWQVSHVDGVGPVAMVSAEFGISTVYCTDLGIPRMGLFVGDDHDRLRIRAKVSWDESYLIDEIVLITMENGTGFAPIDLDEYQVARLRRGTHLSFFVTPYPNGFEDYLGEATLKGSNAAIGAALTGCL